MEDADVGFLIRFSRPTALLGGLETLSLKPFPAYGSTSPALVGYVRYNPLTRHPVPVSEIPDICASWLKMKKSARSLWERACPRTRAQPVPSTAKPERCIIPTLNT